MLLLFHFFNLHIQIHLRKSTPLHTRKPMHLHERPSKDPRPPPQNQPSQRHHRRQPRIGLFCLPTWRHYAYMVFRHIEEPNPFIWNTIIRGFSESQNPKTAISLFTEMLVASEIEPQRLLTLQFSRLMHKMVQPKMELSFMEEL